MLGPDRLHPNRIRALATIHTPKGLTVSTELNDVHSRLNPTRVRRVVTPVSQEEVRQAIRDTDRTPISIGGGRHAMGGQQFGVDTVHLDMRSLCSVLDLDASRGLVRAHAGIQWPALISGIRRLDSAGAWGIRQKQTGASDLTLGGALSANAHGRGLRMKPFVDDVESFRLMDHRGDRLDCSRTENSELFSLAIGGYGLFGVIQDVTLRLAPRRRVMRCVSEESIDSIMTRFGEEIDRGALYGDFQFAIDHESDDFLTRGIFSRYVPVDDSIPIPEGQISFSEERWITLLRLARTRRSEAYQAYRDFYVSTDGQLYDSDTHQLSTYVPRYHDRLTDLPPEAQGSEVITELYVPRPELPAFMQRSAALLRARAVPVTYGTVRLIEPEHETVLPWARRAFACVIFNLLTPHSSHGRERTAEAFRALIDAALDVDGSFFLTYHTHATREQVMAAYPRMPEFLDQKDRYDPQGRFQSTWYQHMTSLLERSCRRSA